MFGSQITVRISCERPEQFLVALPCPVLVGNKVNYHNNTLHLYRASDLPFMNLLTIMLRGPDQGRIWFIWLEALYVQKDGATISIIFSLNQIFTKIKISFSYCPVIYSKPRFRELLTGRLFSYHISSQSKKVAILGSVGHTRSPWRPSNNSLLNGQSTLWGGTWNRHSQIGLLLLFSARNLATNYQKLKSKSAGVRISESLTANVGRTLPVFLN